jgi:hypothetical protein
VRPPAETLARLTERPRPVLAVLVAAQLVLTLALVGSVHHNGWLFYQGGDQLWYATTAWLLAHGQLPYALVGYGWSLVLTPIMALAGPGFLPALPPTILLNVLVLGPLVTVCVYWLGAQLGGRVIGLWAAALWVALPYLTIPLFVQRYHDTYVDQVLPQALGLTAMADYPSMAAVLVSAVLVARSLQRRSLEDAGLAGLVAGFAAGIKPANYLFLAGPALAYLLARRWRAGLWFGAAVAPSAIALAVWKLRGLGELPVLALGEVRSAAGPSPSLPVASSWFTRVVPLDWDILRQNTDYLREFFFSNRLVEWAPLAGALAVARRSPPLSGLLFGWLAAFVFVKGSSPAASIERGDFWRLVMPAFPAFVVLLAAIPLLVPGLTARLARLAPPAAADPASAPRLRRLAVAAAVLVVLPLAVAALWRPSEGPGRTVLVNNILIPVDGGIEVHAARDGAGQRLSWRNGEPGHVFYRVYRTREPGPDTACAGTGAARCILLMDQLTTTRAKTFVDPSPTPGAVYRVGVGANWVDDPEGGDVFVISRPVQAAS